MQTPGERVTSLGLIANHVKCTNTYRVLAWTLRDPSYRTVYYVCVRQVSSGIGMVELRTCEHVRSHARMLEILALATVLIWSDANGLRVDRRCARMRTT